MASHSTEANGTVAAYLATLGNAFGRPVAISCAAFGGSDADARSVARPDPDQNLSAAVLTLERSGLREQAWSLPIPLVCDVCSTSRNFGFFSSDL